LEKLNKILLPSLAKKGLGKTATSAMVCFYAEKWGNGRFKAISFSEGLLKLSARSSAQAMELDMQKEDLLNYMKEFVGKKRIKIIWKTQN